MSFPDKFDEIWSGRDQLAIVEPEPESLFCRWAQTLSDYAAALIEPLAAQERPSAEKIMQAMLRLQRHYFRLLLQAPKNHRKHLSRRGHVCLHPVYEDAYRRLEHLLEQAEDRSLFRQSRGRVADPPAPRSKTIGELLGEGE